MSARTRAFVLLALALALLGAGQRIASRWRIDDRVPELAGDSARRGAYETLVKVFGGDEFVQVRFEKAGEPLSEEDLGWIAETLDHLATLAAVRSLLNPLKLPGGEGDDLLERYRSACARPLVLSLKLGTPRVLTAVVDLEAQSGPEERADLAQRIDSLRIEGRKRGLSLLAAGHPLVAAALDAEAQWVDRRFAPGLVAAAALLVLVSLRSVPLAAAIVLPAALATTLVRAALVLLNTAGNMILVALGPLLFVLVLASGLHPVQHYRAKAHGLTHREAARRAGHETRLTTWIAALTTSAGFLVFAFSSVPAVRKLGITLGLSLPLLIPLAHEFTLLILPLGRRGLRWTRTPFPWSRLALGCSRRPVLPLAMLALALASSAVALNRLRFGTDALAYFPEGSHVRDDFLAIEDRGGSLSSIEVLVPAASISSTQVWASITDSLQALPSVRGVFGPDTVEADCRRATGNLPAPLVLAAQRLAGRISADGEWLHWSLRTTLRDTRGIHDLARGAREAIARVLPEGASPAGITGSLLLLLDAQEGLVGTLGSSLTGTAIVTLLGLLLFVRRPRAVGAAALANLFPVSVVLTTAWILGYSLDASTVMVASVVLGLAVDNTLHILRAAAHRGTAPERAYDDVGPAAWTSALALAGGFAVLTLSGFEPTGRFGLLCSVGVLAALAGDLLLLPALMLEGRRADPPGPVRPIRK